MHRNHAVLGIVGLIGALALPARAAQLEIQIFGQKYNVVKQSRAQTYKNGVQIHLDSGLDGVNNYASPYYAEGPDPSTDRLWFAARIDGGNEAAIGDQIYYLEGPDATGQFTPAAATAKSFFGGNTDRAHGRRPVTIIELNRDDTGKKKDRNVLACTFWDDDSLRMWDLDTMDGYGGSPSTNDTNMNFTTDALYERVHGGVSVATNDAGTNAADPNQPSGSYPAFAHLPTPDGHTVLVAAGPTGDTTSTGICIWDTKTADPSKDDAVGLTETGVVTKGATTPFPTDDGQGNNLNCQAFARYGNQGEYWFLLNQPGAGGSDDSDRTAIILVRAKLELPADLTKAAANSIKVTVLAVQDMKATAADVLFPSGTAGMTGLAVGREKTAGGPRMLYTTDYDGNFYTLTPAQ
jgi:hypothetical protein